MRLPRLSLLSFAAILLVCSGVQAPAADSTGPQIALPPHSISDLGNRFAYAQRMDQLQFRLAQMSPAEGRRFSFSAPFGMVPFHDRGIRLPLAKNDNICYKLRKYVFETDNGESKNGLRNVPLKAQHMHLVGETDCTYSRQVQPKSAQRPDGGDAVREPGVSSTVMHFK